ncbi:DUF4160 domain-containing protein [Membranihabitans maritimus]|uniref:DUF4160 domain-containing protein n=1 Tax=Membranihabitans maritimus TaxID=2904244 RepID=UPI001F4054EC|nr:DUF4160 domain-containing protein [Membranihabitans maritimus]
MPKIYEYLGIILFFYSKEHEPIHVHARKGEYESKVEFLIENGEIHKVIITNVKGSMPLKGKDLKNLKIFIMNYSDSIVNKWVDYFIYNKGIEFERITKKI